ncbi:MAG TPA: class I SAM-dependent methyltransferase [Gaiellaceae bacterium]
MSTLLPVTGLPASAAVRRLFRDAGYDGAGIQALLHSQGEHLFSARDLPVHLRRLDGDERPLALLVRLFLLDAGADPDAAERALGDGLAALQALALVEEADGVVRGTVRVTPCDELLIASDFPRPDAPPDHVASVHRPSGTLSSLTVRRPVRRALDVGTGNGIQALLLASHAEHVVATDVNERALAFAAFNAELNGIGNVELRRGSFLEPVEGERFGVAVANPPYVISPETEFVFRDSGLGRDRVSEELVRAFPSVLEEGAFGTVMISWIRAGGDAAAAPRRWVGDGGCDAWLFHTAFHDALTSAASWNRGAAGEELEQRLDRWLDYYREERIEGIAYGTLVLRRRADGGGWFRSVEVPDGPRDAGGAHVELLFRNQDALAGLDDEALLERVALVCPHTVFEHANRSGPGGWTTVEAALAVRGGIAFRAPLDAPSAALVAELHPSRRVREVVEAAAAKRGEPLEEFTQPALGLVRRLLELGFAELAD